MQSTQRRVVCLGGGFGGLAFCKAMAGADCELLLIDKNNHHLFQPLLYQVATAGLSVPDIASPIRSILSGQKNLTVWMAEVERVDLAGRRVVWKEGEAGYDFLVIALGAVTGYFGHPEWERHAPGLKTLEDAMWIRRRVLHAFERAERETDAEVRRRLMTIVVVGGGPTGVELAGALAELAKRVLHRDFVHIDPGQARIVLVEAAPKILGAFPDPLPQKARRALERLGVEVLTGQKVEDIGPGVIRLPGGRIEAETILWGAGVEAHPLARTLGVPVDRAGRLRVEPDCALPGHPEVCAIGDIVSLVDGKGVRVPGVSPAAMQMGVYAARGIRQALAAGGPVRREPFVYWDKGSMATIGRSAAIAQVGPWKVDGVTAWLLWLLVHLVFLVGFRNRVSVFLHWIYAYATYRRGARIITGLEQRGVAVTRRLYTSAG